MSLDLGFILAQAISLATLVLVIIGAVIARSHFRAQALRDRFEMYQWVESAITEEQITLAEQIPEEYFDLDVFEKRYRGRRHRILRYLAMIQRYHFLFYSYGYERNLIGPYVIDLKRWIRELADITEFQDVHHRYERYYPDFAKYIEGTAPRLGDSTRSCQQPETTS